MLIDEYFAQGKAVAVCVWHENQKLPASVYIKSAQELFPLGDAVVIVTDNPTLCNGDDLEGRSVIRYHFTSSGGCSWR